MCLRLERLTEFDLVQLGVLGFATGLGTTFGAELAKTLFNKFSGWVDKRGKNVKLNA
jgi:hypothetical protein